MSKVLMLWMLPLLASANIYCGAGLWYGHYALGRGMKEGVADLNALHGVEQRRFRFNNKKAGSVYGGIQFHHSLGIELGYARAFMTQHYLLCGDDVDPIFKSSILEFYVRANVYIPVTKDFSVLLSPGVGKIYIRNYGFNPLYECTNLESRKVLGGHLSLGAQCKLKNNFLLRSEFSIQSGDSDFLRKISKFSLGLTYIL